MAQTLTERITAVERLIDAHAIRASGLEADMTWFDNATQ